MARVPTLLSGGNVKTGAVAAQRTAFQGPGNLFKGPGAAPNISFAAAESQASSGRSIAAGMADIAQGAMSMAGAAMKREQVAAMNLAKKQEFDNHLWSESQYTTAQRDWIQWTDDVQKNGSENVVEQFKDKFAKYQEEQLKIAPNEDAANRLKLKLDDLGTRVFDSALKIEANNRVANTVNTFSRMLEDTTDVVVKDPHLAGYPISELYQNLKTAYDQKRIPESTYLKLREKVYDLSAVQAESVAAKDPEFARVVLENAEGLDWVRRKTVLNTIERAEQTNDSLFRYNQQELLKSHLDSLMETGQGVAQFDVNAYSMAFPKEHRAAAIAEVQSKLEIAKTIYVGKNELQGKTPGQLTAVLEKFKPAPGDPKFNDKQAVYQKLNEVADQQVKLFQRDPFSYSRQDPVVDKAWDLVENLPKDAKPGLVQQLTQQALEASMSYQQHAGVPEGKLSAMSQAAAGQYAERINKGDTKQVQEALGQLQGVYGKYYPQAFRDLVRLPEGQRIDAAAQVVAMHGGKPFLTDFLAAVRTPDADLKLDTKDAQQLRDGLTTNPEFMAFRGAMLSANPGAVSMVQDYNHAIEKYAKSMMIRGKAKNASDAVKQATSLVIGSAYGFTAVDGTPVAVKRQQGTIQFNDEDIGTIGFALTNFKKTIPLERVDVSKFVFPLGVSVEVQGTSIKRTLQTDTFWVTNPQNDGATLYMNGMDGTTAPVKWKDGRVIDAKFTTALQYGKGIQRRDRETSTPWWAPRVMTGIGF
jgi:hypothetical protein